MFRNTPIGGHDYSERSARSFATRDSREHLFATRRAEMRKEFFISTGRDYNYRSYFRRWSYNTLANDFIISISSLSRDYRRGGAGAAIVDVRQAFPPPVIIIITIIVIIIITPACLGEGRLSYTLIPSLFLSSAII